MEIKKTILKEQLRILNIIDERLKSIEAISKIEEDKLHLINKWEIINEELNLIKIAIKGEKGENQNQVIIYDEGSIHKDKPLKEVMKKEIKKKEVKKDKETIKRCKKCNKEIEHPRRGMCLNCYRKNTGLSKS